MSKLRPARAQEVQRVLEKIGFVLVCQKGSHAIYRHPDGRYTTVPLHSKNLPKGTLHQILKDVGLTPEEFEKLR